MYGHGGFGDAGFTFLPFLLFSSAKSLEQQCHYEVPKRRYSQKISFIRIYLCRHENKLYYIIINNENNRQLFHKDLLLRDNVTITVGTFFRLLLGPQPITNDLLGIPIVNSNSSVIVMKTPAVIPTYPINNEIEARNFGVTVLNGSLIRVARTEAMQTTCTCKHCDRQRPKEQGCGYWGTSGVVITNLALLHTASVVDGNTQFMIRNFSSNRFDLDIFFQDISFPQTVQLAALNIQMLVTL